MKEVRSGSAPDPVGPYSQAVDQGGWVFCSGQIPLDPVTGKLVSGGIEDQTRRVLANLRAVLEAAGLSFDHVVRTTIYLTNLSDFPRVNAVYGEHFAKNPPPARATVQVAGLPLGAQIEIDAIASRGR